VLVDVPLMTSRCKEGVACGELLRNRRSAIPHPGQHGRKVRGGRCVCGLRPENANERRHLPRMCIGPLVRRPVDLPAIVRERLVGLGHSMGVFLFLYRVAFAL
jgi:hypothetical protein